MSSLTRILCILSSIFCHVNSQALSTYISTIYCSSDSVSSQSITAGATVYYRIFTTEEWVVTVDNCATSWDSQMKILDSNENDISTGLYCDGDGMNFIFFCSLHPIQIVIILYRL